MLTARSAHGGCVASVVVVVVIVCTKWKWTDSAEADKFGLKFKTKYGIRILFKLKLINGGIKWRTASGKRIHTWIKQQRVVHVHVRWTAIAFELHSMTRGRLCGWYGRVGLRVGWNHSVMSFNSYLFAPVSSSYYYQCTRDETNKPDSPTAAVAGVQQLVDYGVMTCGIRPCCRSRMHTCGYVCAPPYACNTAISVLRASAEMRFLLVATRPDQAGRAKQKINK